VSGLRDVMLLALLPGLGVAVGGLIAETVPRSQRWLNWALHGAAGIVIAIAAIEVFPDALDAVSAWTIGIAFAAGGLAYLGAQVLIERRTASGDTRMWMIFLAVATDLFGDGLLIGAGTAVSPTLGVTLAIGQIMANVPEGFASIATFRGNDVPRSTRLWLTAAFVVPSLAAALAGFLILRNQPESWQYTALVAAAGLYTVAAFEDIITEAHEAAADGRRSTLALIGGFVLFVFISAALGD
jgi:ZIP family zinc transporter